MSKAFLGETFDIHGGGLDLIFPHHENEIAQSCCANGTARMANVWMHNGYLQVEGRKMSKSEGNFVTVHDLLHTEKVGGRKWSGEVVRLAILMTHYREPLDFTVRRLEEAEATLSNLKLQASPKQNLDHEPLPLFVEALESELMVNSALKIHRDFEPIFTCDDRAATGSGAANLNLLGFSPERRRSSNAESLVQSGALKRMIQERATFIADENWLEADRIRDGLLSQGIQLKDAKHPDTGERFTTWEVV